MSTCTSTTPKQLPILDLQYHPFKLTYNRVDKTLSNSGAPNSKFCSCCPPGQMFDVTMAINCTMCRSHFTGTYLNVHAYPVVRTCTVQVCELSSCFSYSTVGERLDSSQGSTRIVLAIMASMNGGGSPRYTSTTLNMLPMPCTCLLL